MSEFQRPLVIILVLDVLYGNLEYQWTFNFVPRASVVKGSSLWMGKQTSCFEGCPHLVVLFDSIARLCFHKRDYFLSLYNQCVYIHFPCPTLHINNWQNSLYRLMETSSKACRIIVKQTDAMNHEYYGLKSIEVNMYRCADEKICNTENKVTVANCDVENLDH